MMNGIKKTEKMSFIKKVIGHYKTVSEHRKLVRQGCFRIGLFGQGLLHDLSKYSPTEFMIGVKYFQGFRSPNNAEREKKGYSSAWLHHKGRNKHHFEYWVDYSSRSGVGIIPVKMPDRYLAEMYCDRVAATKIYNKEKYNDTFPLEYLKNGTEYTILHEDTKKELEKLLTMLATKGESVTEQYIRKNLLKYRPGAVIVEIVNKVKEMKAKRVNK